MADVFCRSCGKGVPAGTGFCASCGTAVQGAAPGQPAGSPFPPLPPANWGPPAGYAPAPGGYGQAPQPTNGFAITSLVLSLVCLYGVGSILAIIFGNIARRQIREQGGQGDGMAKAGIIIGWVSLGIGVMVILAMVIARSSDSGSSY